MRIYDMTGVVHLIKDEEIKTDTFKKREFVIIIHNNVGSNTYKELIKFQCINDNIKLLNDVDVKDSVIVKFKFSGKEYNGSYYNNLDVSDIGVISKHATGPVEIKPGDTNDYSQSLPGLDEGSVDLSGIGSQEKTEEKKEEFNDLPF